MNRNQRLEAKAARRRKRRANRRHTLDHRRGDRYAVQFAGRTNLQMLPTMARITEPLDNEGRRREHYKPTTAARKARANR
jgi:hypothetical protein